MHVSMLRAGSTPVRLLDDERPSRPRRFDAWLERFWVRLFVQDARPTTASL
jgi:hypothetical protein